MTKGEHETAIRHYQRSLELDPDNSNALKKIEQLAGEQRVSHVSAE
jgi:tetratricopeptide (TPR) repeat protein